MEGILSASIYGKVLFDEEGDFYAANQSAHKIIESLTEHPETFNQQELVDFMFDNAVDMDENLRNAIVSYTDPYSGQEENFREVVQLKNGRLFLIIAQKTKLKYTLFILFDISRQWRQEASFTLLGEKNNQLMMAIEAASVGVIISTPKRRGNPVSFVNSAAGLMTGFAKEDLAGKYWWQLFEVFDKDEMFDSLIEAAFERKSPAEISLSRVDEDGRSHWYSMAITPVLDDYGAVDLFIGILKDTTDLKVKEAEFFQAQKLEALGQLSAGIAHDFNNILSIIDGYTRLASKKLDSDAAVCEDYLQRVCTATQRGAALTKRLLTFSRHKVVAEKTSDLRQVVQDQEILLSAVLDPSIKLVMQAADENVFVKSSPDVISQILMNLVINARDAIEAESGTITIHVDHPSAAALPDDISARLDDERDYARLSVADTGCGMDQNTREKLFDPFFTTKSADRGTGLGMSVVYGLVKDMDGYIDIQSAPGDGSVISIYLPLSSDVPEEVSLAPMEVEGKYLSRYTAMVVDDEPDVLEITCSMLRDVGMTVIEAVNGNDALAKQDEYEGKIDILVTDVLMPELNGIKLAELFLSLRPDTNVLYISGYPALRDDDHIQIPEHSPFLAKPVEYEKLIGLIGELVSHPGNMNEENDLMKDQSHWTFEYARDKQVKK